MTIIYRTNGPWGAGQGSNLSAAEVDGNFFDLDQQIAGLTADHHNVLRSIDHVSVDSSNNLFVFYTDGSSDGPFKLPVASWNFTGNWLPTTNYVGQRDLFSAAGGVYLVLLDSTSASTFDPNATDGSGHDLYKLIFQKTIPSFTVSTDTFQPDISYTNSYIRCTNAHGCLITIPDDTTVEWQADTEMHFRDCGLHGTSGISFIGLSGVTFNSIDGRVLTSAAPGAVIGMKHIGVSEWDIWGLLELV